MTRPGEERETSGRLAPRALVAMGFFDLGLAALLATNTFGAAGLGLTIQRTLAIGLVAVAFVTFGIAWRNR